MSRLTDQLNMILTVDWTVKLQLIQTCIFILSDIGSGYLEIVPGGRLLIINGHELFITTTESTDSGLYRCNASNSQGSVMAFARLTVFGKTFVICSNCAKCV